MTTYRLGWRFSLAAIAYWLVIGIAFSLLPHWRYRLLLLLMLSVLIQIAGRLRTRCTSCRKSAFVTEIFGRRDTFIGWATSRVRWTPEQLCSRCGADLTIQASR